MRFGIVKPAPPPPPPPPGDDDDSKVPAALKREDYAPFEALLGYTFKEFLWLDRALTHRSAQGRGPQENDYERLEFLGDAVIDLAVAELLIESHPDAREGDLSKMRAALVNEASLAAIGRSLGLSSYIRLSRAEMSNGGAERASILADVTEALVGAIYKEAGFDAARTVIARLFGDQVKTVKPSDPKTELQEALHASGSSAPLYLLECVEGPEHAPVFVSIVKVDGQIVGRGRGPTKKASQQAAASEALEKIIVPETVETAEPATAETKGAQ